MRYIALIALVDFLALAGLLLVLPEGLTDVGGALLLSAIICAIAVPIAVVVGIPALWLARWFAVGSWVPLAIVGPVAGASIPMFIMGRGTEQLQMIIAGALLGLLSALLWWGMVERHPERRLHYD